MKSFRQKAMSYQSQNQEEKSPTMPDLPPISAGEEFEMSIAGGWYNSGRHQIRPIPRSESLIDRPAWIPHEKDLSVDQAAVFKELCHWFEDGGHGYSTLGGYAGTGKSTLISVFAQRYQSHRIAYCAFTGKAANVLKQKLKTVGIDQPAFVGTIHRLIYNPESDANSNVLGWKLQTNLDYDLIVVDEASMVNEQMFTDLRSFNIPILAVGDHGQLAPIEGKFNLMEQPNLRLEKIHRQAEHNPIIQLSAYIREHGELPRNYEDNEHVQFIKPALLRPRLEAYYGNGASVGPDTAMLCYTNSKRRMANNLIREIRWGVREGDAPLDGDTIICLRNSLGVLFNGMRARIVHTAPRGGHWQYAHMVFEEDELEVRAMLFKHQFNRDQTFNNSQQVFDLGFRGKDWAKEMGLLFDFGYAITVHKAQGSSYKDVFVLYERPSTTWEDFKRWLYTAVTRSSERLVVVTR